MDINKAFDKELKIFESEIAKASDSIILCSCCFENVGSAIQVNQVA